MAEDKSPVASPPPAASDPPAAGDKPESSAQADAPTSTESQNEELQTNGDNGPQPTADDTNESKAENQDTEMTDAPANAEAASGGVNGTPTSNKKASNGSAKKKSSAVPEHKSKKLNKKKSKTNLHLDAKPGALYLARWKGAQPWPSIVCDEEMLPTSLLKTRPVTTAQPDGTFKKPEYEDGGKRAHERTFPIMFLYTNEFAWIPNTDLAPLDPEECKDVAEKGKSKSLLEAYGVAAENHDLAYFKHMLIEHQEAMVEDAERRAEREAKKAQKAKRKSDAAAVVEEGDEEDELDLEDDEQTSKPKARKRKKSVDSDGAEKPAKTPKTKATKLKLTTPKVPESSSKKKAAKPRSTSKKSAAKADGSDDEMMIDTPAVEEKPLTPAEAKEKKEKEIRYYRHKLQKGFLSRDTIPGDEEIQSMSGYLSKLETFPDLEGSIIRATKIHKVLKAMIRLQSIPKDDEFTFKKRSIDLLSKWNKILADDPSGAAAGDKDDDKNDDKPETNGAGKDSIADATKSDSAEPAADDEKKAEADQSEATAESEKKAEPEVEKASEPAAPAEEPKADEPMADAAPAEGSTTAAAEAVENTA